MTKSIESGNVCVTSHLILQTHQSYLGITMSVDETDPGRREGIRELAKGTQIGSDGPRVKPKVFQISNSLQSKE